MELVWDLSKDNWMLLQYKVHLLLKKQYIPINFAREIINCPPPLKVNINFLPMLSFTSQTGMNVMVTLESNSCAYLGRHSDTLSGVNVKELRQILAAQLPMDATFLNKKVNKQMRIFWGLSDSDIRKILRYRFLPMEEIEKQKIDKNDPLLKNDHLNPKIVLEKLLFRQIKRIILSLMWGQHDFDYLINLFKYPDVIEYVTVDKFWHDYFLLDYEKIISKDKRKIIFNDRHYYDDITNNKIRYELYKKIILKFLENTKEIISTLDLGIMGGDIEELINSFI